MLKKFMLVFLAGLMLVTGLTMPAASASSREDAKLERAVADAVVSGELSIRNLTELEQLRFIDAIVEEQQRRRTRLQNRLEDVVGTPRQVRVVERLDILNLVSLRMYFQLLFREPSQRGSELTIEKLEELATGTEGPKFDLFVNRLVADGFNKRRNATINVLSITTLDPELIRILGGRLAAGFDPEIRRDAKEDALKFVRDLRARQAAAGLR